MNYAKNGWIQPLDDLFEKYRAEFRLDDIAPASLRGVTYKGRVYALPLTTNTLLYAYRGDIFREAQIAAGQNLGGVCRAGQDAELPPAQRGQHQPEMGTRRPMNCRAC